MPPNYYYKRKYFFGKAMKPVNRSEGGASDEINRVGGNKKILTTDSHINRVGGNKKILTTDSHRLVSQITRIYLC